jgi:3-oxoacyl-[acyl-carrier protein] reductase
MSQPLKGKVAIITGGSKGIGRATALRLARDGAKVVINFSSDSSAADEVVKLIGPENCIAIKADAGDVSQLEMLVAETIKVFGKIDILVPNAGIMPMQDLESSKEADFDRTVRLNVKGPYFLAQVSRQSQETEPECKC